MSRILRINRQIQAEAEEVLYGGNFVFSFPRNTKANIVNFWLDVLGAKQAMVKHISVFCGFELEKLSDADGAPGKKDVARGRNIKKEAWTILRDNLVGLKTVRIEMSFTGTLTGGEPGRERAMREIMGLVDIFGGLARVVPDQNPSALVNEERPGIVMRCNNLILGRYRNHI